MRIGLVGAPCTGKTTLAKAVAERLGITFIGESFEDAKSQCTIRDLRINTLNDPWPDYFKRVWNDTNNYFDEIVNFTKGIAWDLEEKERFAGDNFITDSAAPSQAAAGLIYNTFLEDIDELMAWYNYQLKRAMSYDYLFFIPINPNIKMEDDNRRPVNRALQKQFDLILPSLLVCDLEVEVDALFGTVEERVQHILQVVTK